jgi:hypothetical protein
LDLVIETDPAKFTDEHVIDKFGNLTKMKVELDDNIHINPSAIHRNPKLTVEIPKIEHPKNIKIIPVLLDDRRHLVGLE